MTKKLKQQLHKTFNSWNKNILTTSQTKNAQARRNSSFGIFTSPRPILLASGTGPPTNFEDCTKSSNCMITDQKSLSHIFTCFLASHVMSWHNFSLLEVGNYGCKIHTDYGTKWLWCKIYMVRNGFWLQSCRYGFLFCSEFFFRTTQELEYLFFL